MTGTIREAVIALNILTPGQQPQSVEAVIDTGFNGYLTLSGEMIHRLALPSAGHRRAVLGDGTVVVLNAYLAKVFWHEQAREVLILQAEGGPLLGMSLLFGSRITIDVIEKGDVKIDVLPSEY